MLKPIVDFIYRLATGERHIRMLFTPVLAAFFLFLIALAIFLALSVDAFLSLAPPLQYP